MNSNAAIFQFFMKSFLFGMILLAGSCGIMAQSRGLISGEPIKNGSPDNTGRFAVPFYNGYNMGMADVNGDGINDLFLQGVNFSARGVYLYLFKRSDKDGTPVFSHAHRIETPFSDKGNNRGVIFQDKSGRIFCFWKFGRKLRWSEFDKKTLSFSSLEQAEITVAHDFKDFGIFQLPSGKYYLFFSTGKKGNYGPGTAWPRVVSYTPEGFWPYDLAEVGISGDVIDDFSRSVTVKPEPLTSSDQTYFTFDGFTSLTSASGIYILTGSRLGNIHTYRFHPKNFKFIQEGFVTDERGVILRNPDVHAFISAFRSPTGEQGIVTVGEGGIYYYKFERESDGSGNLVFSGPGYLKQEAPDLYGGSLVAPSLGDWDGDGVTDIISGTSTGHIWFFKNAGSDSLPVFIDPVALKAGGYDIHVQPGYREDIQGPGEARWGYTNPTVFDWNDDGLPDILLGDSRGKFTVYMNEGSQREPKLAAEHPLYLKGLDVFGTWRVRPAAGKLGSRNAYIIMDKDDEFHLYWQLDKYNLEDGGKLTIGDSIFIRGSRLSAGAVGRATLQIVDWDLDGVKDLLAGTYGKQSIPEPKNGLPYYHNNSKATVLFLRNSGTDEKPVYEYPKMLKFKGKNLQFGGHSCTPAAGFIGPGKSLNLIVGEEGGRYFFYERKDLEW